VTSEFLNVKNPTGAEPVPGESEVLSLGRRIVLTSFLRIDSGLIYIAHTPQNGTASYLPGFNENVTLPFEAGKTYRLRIINMSALSMYHFWLEGHDMRIIEADGVDMQELPVDLVSISVAQRYSVLVTARNDTSENWIIHANQDPVMFDVVPPEVQLNLTSTISYAEGNPIGSGVATIGAVDDEGMYPYFDDTTLVPIVVMPMVEADVSHTLAFNFDTYSDGKNYAAFNSKSFVAPQVPTLLTAQTMPLNYTTDAATYGPNTNVVVMNHLDMVEIVLANLDAGSHPMHIHGTQFQIVHKSRDDASMDPAINPPFREGLTNPARRDTITIPAGGSATIRFRADNPGAWLLHCHIGELIPSVLAYELH
jgi:iron transport multicopper oxidase